MIISVTLTLHCSTSVITASGGFDNGTATGKGKIGLDLTWNPFNYFPKGQSYVVLSYGFSDKFDIHGYYSIPAHGSDNYYIGFFYQFFENKYFDLATAVGIRQYRSKSNIHLYTPQLLYTFNIHKDYRLGGSFVTIKDMKNNLKNLGTTIDIGLIIPLIKSHSENRIIYSMDFCIGYFKPILWVPNNGDWHPTYSFDIKLNL